MKRHKNFNLLLMLVLLVAVGQMAQTIYIPAIADMAVALNVREGAVQSVMAAYLLTYGISQLFYGPLSDRVGRRPVILVGMSIFMLATLVAITTHSLPVLIAASAMQGMGTGVGGVMARTLPRDLYEGAQLRHANSLLNMGILVSPLIAPLLGGILDTLWSWRACYAFLLVLCAGVTFSMAKWMPETRPEGAPRTKLLASYKTLFGTGAFNCYLLMLIGGLAGIAVFEACSGVLMGAVLGLSDIVETLYVTGCSVVTSGDYQRYYVVDGQRYHHLIDPDTLMPDTDFRSVSIITEDSGYADLLSTAAFLMPYEESRAFVDSLDGVEAIWLFPDGSKKMTFGAMNVAKSCGASHR